MMNSSIPKSKNRVKKALDSGFEYHHLALARSRKFLRKHVSDRLPMYVLYVDLVGSTKMSSALSPDTLNVIIRTFSQEMAYVIEDYGGYVLKFVGDAVLGYFVVDKNSKSLANRVIECAKTMNIIIEKAINPVLEEEGIPSLKVKVSVDFGKCSVVRYGSDQRRSHIDLIGLTLNLAAKMQSMASPRQIIIGEHVFTKLKPKLKKSFIKAKTNPKEWKYHELGNNSPYSVYSSKASQI